MHKWNHHITAKIDQQDPTTTTATATTTSTLNVPSDIKAALLPQALVPALPLDLVPSTVQTVNTLLFNVLLPTTRRQLQQGGLVVYAHAAFVFDHATSPLAKNVPMSEQSTCDLSTDLRCVALSNESMCWTTRVPDGFPTLSKAMTNVALVGIVFWILRSPRVISMQLILMQILATCVLFTPLLRALGPCGTGLCFVNGKCAECPAGLVYAPMALVCDPMGRWENISTEDLGGNGASTSGTSPIKTIPNSAQEATAVFAAFICLGLLAWVVMILVRRCQKDRQNGMDNDDATTSSFTASGSASREQYDGPNPTSRSPSSSWTSSWTTLETPSSRAAESSVPFGASPPNRSCSTTTGCSQQQHAPSQAGYTRSRLTTGGGEMHGREWYSPPRPRDDRHL